MSSYLLCAPPIYGHLAPLVTVGRGLITRGHDVTLLTGAKYRSMVIDAGLEHVSLPDNVDFDDARLEELLSKSSRAKGIAAVRESITGVFVRVIPGQHRALTAVLEQGQFDAVLAEATFTGIAPYLAQPRQDRLPVLGLATTPVTLSSVDTAPFGANLPPGRGRLGRFRNRALTAALRPGLTSPVRRAVDERLAEVGAPPSQTDTFDFAYRCFDDLYQLSVADLEYPRREMPRSVHFVGPLRANDDAQKNDALPNWWSDLHGERHVVHVTQGTIDNVDLGRLIAPTLRALARLDVIVVASTGGRPVADVERALGGPVPANARVATHLPYDRFLPLCDVVVTNGGFGGVQRALAHGVPLVVAGSTEDKPEVAARVAWSGCGQDLRTGTPRPETIARAVREALTNPTFSAQSKKIAAVIAALPDPIDVIAEGLTTATTSRARHPRNDGLDQA